jgi:LmbE family N-acetylglucosaminyl deacetylase
MSEISRRDLFLGGAATLLPLAIPQDKKKLKIIAAGGHPDDPESGAGGTIARYADLGHDAANLYLTRGEAGIKGKSHDEAAAIRSAEIEKACAILKARAIEMRLNHETRQSPGYDLLPKLRALRIPTLVIAGENDFVPADVAAQIAEAIPNARLVTIKACGHFAYLECRAEVRQALHDFLH